MSAAATSKVDICNLALDYLKQQPVSNIDSPTNKTEEICARWYDSVRRASLRKLPWHFAKKREKLAKNGTNPLFGFASAYDLPNDFLRLVNLGTKTGSIREYTIENNQILINQEDIFESTGALPITYIRDVIEVAKFDSVFVDYFAAELALRMVYKFGGSNTDYQRVSQVVQDLEIEARTINGQERPPIYIERSSLDEARENLKKLNILETKVSF